MGVIFAYHFVFLFPATAICCGPVDGLGVATLGCEPGPTGNVDLLPEFSVAKFGSDLV